MKILKKLNEVRKPIYKTITLDRLKDTSSLYTNYLNGQLTRKMIYESNEDPFVLAFYYNEKYEILEYLKYLKQFEITNVTYNVIKQNIKSMEKQVIDDFLSSPSSTFNFLCLSVMKGEIYRMNGFELFSETTIPNEFEVLGFVSLLEMYLESFDEVFDRYVKLNRNFIFVLDCENEKVKLAIVRNLPLILDVVSESSILFNILDLLDFETMNNSDISEIILKNLSNLDKIVEKILEIKSFDKILKIVFLTAHKEKVFIQFKDFIVSKIKDCLKQKKIAVKKSICQFLFIMKYYNCDISFVEKYSFDLKDAENTCFAPLGNSRKELLDKIMNSNSFVETCELFYHFENLINSAELSLEEIIGLPERFFSLALKRNTTPDGSLLLKFHTNLCNQKIKENVANSISRDIFVKYLIKRNIYFKISMDDYVEYMSNEYKMLYAENNLEWASKNLELLFSIGLPRRLYYKIKNSEYSYCLSDYDVDRCLAEQDNLVSETKSQRYWHLESDSDCSEVQNVPLNEVEEEQEGPSKKICIKNDEEDSEVICSVLEVNDFHSKKLSVGINSILEVTFIGITEFKEDYSSFIENIHTNDDFLYVLTNLYSWTQKSRHLKYLEIFLNQSIKYFNVKYEEIREIVRGIYNRQKNSELITNIIPSIQIGDIETLIDDYKDLIDPISQGLINIKSKFTEQKPSEEYINLIKKLLISSKNYEALVGIKAFDIKDYPDFDVSELLSSTNDLVVLEALEHLKPYEYNEKLLKLLFKRAVLDEIASKIISKLNISEIEPNDLSRIYQLFYLSPLNYIKYKIYKHGFFLNENIAVELILVMDKVFNKEQFEEITGLFKGFEFTELCYSTMIKKIETPNYFFKKWIADNIDTSTITLPYFVKLCLFIANEDDLGIVKTLLEKLQKGKVFDVVDKWAEMRKLERLNRRVYPLRLNNLEFYKKLLSKCEDKEEVEMLKQVYHSKLN